MSPTQSRLKAGELPKGHDAVPAGPCGTARSAKGAL